MKTHLSKRHEPTPQRKARAWKLRGRISGSGTVEPLEGRIAPATFTGAGTVLTIDLTALNELVTFSTDGTTITAQLTGGTGTDGGGLGGNVTGFGTSTLLITSAGFTTINIGDSAAGDAVAFGNSTGVYPQAFGITLNDAASGNVTFTGASTFGASLIASTTAGFFASDLTSSVTLTGGASNLALTALGHDVLLKGALVVGGTTAITANVIEADNAANDFTGALQLSGPVAASVFDVNALDLAASNFNFGGLAQTVHITAGGNITQSGALTSTSTGTLSLTSLGGSINLPTTTNALSNLTALELSTTGANGATFYNAGVLVLGDIRMETGTLTVTTTSNLVQLGGTTIETDGAVAVIIDQTNNHDVSLFNAGNRIGGPVTIATTGGGGVRDVSLRNAADNASLPTGTPLTTAGDVRNLTLFFDHTGMVLPGYNISSNLVVTAGGDITQTGPLLVPGTSSISVLGDFGITLTDAGNNLDGAISISATQSTQTVSLVNSTDLTFNGVLLGRGAFNATALTGNINETGSGGFIQEKGALTATFTVTAGDTITLNTSTNRITGPMVFLGAALDTVNVRNADFQADIGVLTIPATVTDLTVRFDNAPVALPSFNIADLSINAQGIVQQAGTSLIISGDANFTGNAFPINLTNAGNDFTNLEIDNSGRNDVAVVDVDDVSFINTSAMGFGRFTLTTGGAITQTGTITQANTGPGGDVILTSTAGSITLTNGNAFRGPVSVTVSGTNTASITNNAAALLLGTIQTGTGAFAAGAGNQGIAQDPNSVLTLGGVSSFAVTGGGPVVLGNRTNTFTGAVSVSGNSATVRAVGPVVFGTSDVSGGFFVKTTGAATDSITQTGAITGNGAGSFDAGAGNILLTNAGNNFGSVSLFSTGTTVSVRDSNALAVGTVLVGGGTLTFTTGGNLTTSVGGSVVQTTGTGAITVDTPGGNNVTLDSALNHLLGTVNILHSSNVTVRTQGDLAFTPGSSVTGQFNPTSGGILTLPTTLTNLTGLNISAVSTTLASDVTTSGAGITLTGGFTLTGNRIITSGGNVTINGDLTAGGTLTLNLPAGQTVALGRGTWDQGANALTINGNNVILQIGDNLAPGAELHLDSGTISMPGNGNMTVQADGTLSVDAGPGADTLTVANGSGNLTFTGNLSVGFGTTNDRLIKTGTGLINLNPGAHLLGTGLAGVDASPVLASQTAIIIGRFANSADGDDVPHDFLAGSDIVTPAYDFTQLTVKAGGVTAPSGTITGFLPDGDKYTVKSSLGAGAGLVVVEDLSGRLGIVVRNNTVAGASTLTISALGGGDGILPISGVMVHAPGSVAVAAPAANFIESLHTTGTLTSLVARDLAGTGGNQLFHLTSGGLETGKTTLSVRNVELSTMEFAGTLGSFKAISASNGVDITAFKFGTITTTGGPAGTNPLAPGVPNPGDFIANLTSTTPTSGIVITNATIAGNLSGTWDVSGTVSAVKAAKTTSFTLGTAPGTNNAVNGGLLIDAKTLTLGLVNTLSLNATGNVTTLNATEIGNSTLTANTFGTVKVAANPALGLVGNLIGTTLRATGNTGGVALKSLSVAGEMSGSNVILVDGDGALISVSRTISNSTITANDVNNHGNLKTLTAGRWQSTNVDAQTIGTLKVTGNLPAGLFGDFTGSTITVRGNTGVLGLGTFDAQGSVLASTFDIQNGDVTLFKAGRQISSTTVRLTDAAFGNLKTIQAGDWGNGVNVLAKTLGTVASVGAPAIQPASPLLLGGMNTDTITAYLNTGTAVAIGKVTVKGDVTNSVLSAEHGITGLTVGRTVSGSLVIVDDAMDGVLNVGRIPTLTAGALTNSTISANTLGSVKVTGFARPENGTSSFVAGDVTTTIFYAHGATPAKVAVDAFNVAGNFISTSVLNAPSGIKAFTVAGSVTASRVNADNPATPENGFINTFTAGDIATSTIRAGHILTMKTTGKASLGLLGNINSSTIVATAGAPTTGVAQALGTLTVAGDFSDSVLDAPGSVGKMDVLGRIAAVTTSTRVQAGYESGSKVGSISAGAWGQASALETTDLVTQSIGSLTLKGNTARGFVGTTDGAFMDILGNAAGVGLGTFSGTGAVTKSLIRVSDGDVTSFTALRLVSSDLLVGFRFVKASDLTQAPTAANWATTNHKIGKFATTAPFDLTDLEDSASFVDSNVVAAILGSITIAGVNPEALNATAFGVAFRTSAGASAGGVVRTDGVAAPLVAPASDGQFAYVGLAG
jgi:hypothetical protein